MKKIAIMVFLNLFCGLATAETVLINLTVPVINEQPYHRPYIAVWLETPNRVGVHSIAVWHEKDKWLKDLRQWWRKLGRDRQENYDAVSAATRKPGQYQLIWRGLDQNGNQVASGEYYLCFEAAREDGGREFVRQKIQLGLDLVQAYQLNANTELGLIDITVK